MASYVRVLTPEEIKAIEPSWKPLLWFSGIFVALIALWEVFLDFGMDLIEISPEAVPPVPPIPPPTPPLAATVEIDCVPDEIDEAPPVPP